MEKNSDSIVFDSLGLCGWQSLEPVVLASLASRMPVLLVGYHGSGKSLAIESIAKALGLDFRSYNASLINYDDLTGIPVPSADFKELSYISSDCSIWDAQAVFMDEINRTKPELQNKLFPIIYDRRIQGKLLERLEYRWAAMNPCKLDDDTDSGDSEDITDPEYFGAFPLDPALADRFPFIIEVPVWSDFSLQDKLELLKGHTRGKNGFGNANKLYDAIRSIREAYDNLDNETIDISAHYIAMLCDCLSSSFGYVSSRRSVMMHEAFMYLYSALCVLESCDARFSQELFENCAKIHIKYVIPDLASGRKIDAVKMQGIVSQALTFTFDSVDNRLIDLQKTKSVQERLVRALKMNGSIDTQIVSDTVTDCVFSMSKFKRRAAALISYLVLRKNEKVYATVIESFLSEIRPIFNPSFVSESVPMRQRKIADRVNLRISEIPLDIDYGKKYIGNLLNSFLLEDDGYTSESDVDELFRYSTYLAKLFPDAFKNDSNGKAV